MVHQPNKHKGHDFIVVQCVHYNDNRVVDMANEKIVLYGMTLLLMAFAVQGLSCTQSYGEFTPFGELTYYCEDVAYESCFAAVLYENITDGLINVNPQVQTNDISHYNGFDVVHNTSIVTFSTKNLRHEYSYNFTVACGHSEVSWNVSPSIKTFQAPYRGWIWVRDWANWIVAGVIFLALAVMIIYSISKKKYG